MFGIEQVLPVLFAQVEATPVIVPVAVGADVTATVVEADVPLPQVFVGVTCMVPPDVANDAVILRVFVPFVMVAPAGKVQLYPVAFAMFGIEQEMPVLFTQVEVAPIIVPAAVGNAIIATVVEADVPLPQVFVGVTCMVPPAVANDTVIIRVFAPFVIAAPAGTVHV